MIYLKTKLGVLSYWDPLMPCNLPEFNKIDIGNWQSLNEVFDDSEFTYQFLEIERATSMNLNLLQQVFDRLIYDDSHNVDVVYSILGNDTVAFLVKTKEDGIFLKLRI